MSLLLPMFLIPTSAQSHKAQGHNLEKLGKLQHFHWKVFKNKENYFKIGFRYHAMAVHAIAVASSCLKICKMYVLLSFAFITEAYITYDRISLLNVGQRSVGISFSAVDLETIAAHSIFRPPSQNSRTKRHQK